MHLINRATLSKSVIAGRAGNALIRPTQPSRGLLEEKCQNAPHDHQAPGSTKGHTTRRNGREILCLQLGFGLTARPGGLPEDDFDVRSLRSDYDSHFFICVDIQGRQKAASTASSLSRFLNTFASNPEVARWRNANTRRSAGCISCSTNMAVKASRTYEA